MASSQRKVTHTVLDGLYYITEQLKKREKMWRLLEKTWAHVSDEKDSLHGPGVALRAVQISGPGFQVRRGCFFEAVGRTGEGRVGRSISSITYSGWSHGAIVG
jgi:hypothetical protein